MKASLLRLGGLFFAALHAGCPPPPQVLPEGPLKVAPAATLDCTLVELVQTEASTPIDFAVGADSAAVAVAFSELETRTRVEVATVDGLALDSMHVYGAPWRPVALIVDADRVVVAARSPSRHRVALLEGRIGSSTLEVAWEAGDELVPDAWREIALSRTSTNEVVAIEFALGDASASVRDVDGRVRGTVRLADATALLVGSATSDVMAIGVPSPTAAMIELRRDEVTGGHIEIGRSPVTRLAALQAAFVGVARPVLLWLTDDGDRFVLSALDAGTRRHAAASAELDLRSPIVVGPTSLMGGSLLFVDAAAPQRLGMFWLDGEGAIESATTFIEWIPGVATAAAPIGESDGIVAFADYHGAEATRVVLARLDCQPQTEQVTP